jgi:bacterioferritin
LLHEDYAGMMGEMTAANQYLYQYFLLCEKHFAFAHAVECIALTERLHIELLGKAIVRLGGTPRFSTYNTYWSANFVNYIDDRQRMLDCNLSLEDAAICNYRFHIEMISNSSVKRLLERIVLDEELHIKLFSEMLNDITSRI